MLKRGVADLSGLEEKIIARATSLEEGVRDSFDTATTGVPVGGSQRKTADTDELYKQADPTFLARMQSMGKYLSTKEKEAENRRSLRVGGFYVYPDVAPKDAARGYGGREPLDA